MKTLKHQEHVMNIELCNAVQRLIAEWRGNDASTQTARLPELVAQIVRIKEAASADVARLASHDAAEAA